MIHTTSTIRRVLVLVTVLISVRVLAQDAADTDPDRTATVEFSVEQLVFLPPVFYVGDVVECRIRITTSGTLPARPATIPEAEWIDIHDVIIIPIADRYEIRVRFSPFRPGELEIPRMEIGEIVLEPIPFQTASIREEDDSSLYGVFDPLLLPGTKLLIGIAAGVVIFGPLLLLLLGGWTRKAVRRIAGALSSRRPYRRLTKELDALSGVAGTSTSREYFQVLFDSFRAYLTERSERNYQATTTTEMAFLARDEFDAIVEVGHLARMIPIIDAAKYGGVEAGSEDRERSLELVRQSAAEIERAYRSRNAG